MQPPLLAPPRADGPANVPTLRTLGTGATQAIAGNDSRIPSSSATADNQGLQRQAGSLVWTTQMTLPAVKSVALSNITLSGAQTVTGVALVAGDLCLVTAQTTGSQNGLYTVASGSWTRHSSAATTGQVVAGQTCFVTSGLRAGVVFVVTNTTVPTIGTDTISFVQFSGPILIFNGSGTGTTATVGLTANQYTKLEYYIDWNSAQTLSSITLTGISSNTYQEGGTFALFGSTNGTFSGTLTGANWLTGATSAGPGDCQGTIHLPPAPLKKRHFSTAADSVASRTWWGHSSDTTHDPTGLVFTFGGSTTWTLKVWGSN